MLSRCNLKRITSKNHRTKTQLLAKIRPNLPIISGISLGLNKVISNNRFYTSDPTPVNRNPSEQGPSDKPTDASTEMIHFSKLHNISDVNVKDLKPKTIQMSMDDPEITRKFIDGQKAGRATRYMDYQKFNELIPTPEKTDTAKVEQLEILASDMVNRFDTVTKGEFPSLLDKAIDTLEDALTYGPNEHQLLSILYLLGVCYTRDMNWEKSSKYYETILAIDNEYVPAYKGLGEASQMLGLYQKAIAQYQLFLDTFIDYYTSFESGADHIDSEWLLASTLYNRGVCYFKFNDMNCSAGDLNTVVELDTNLKAPAYAMLGKISYDYGEYNQAIAYCNDAIATDPDCISAYQLRSQTYDITDKEELGNLDRNTIRLLKFKRFKENAAGLKIPRGHKTIGDVDKVLLKSQSAGESNMVEG
eukprot:TRINITY_DN10756_c0_g1_i1.p1 TRINITY_DN10756_c0_g1~~TRINITY_DN10756_c0_g1_i1.p1  ORF type:complete len:417 (-),score=79.05 TRINITY_DN10756_c0_g1_i1:57-1307(-)